MDTNFTLNELAEFAQQEQALFNELNNSFMLEAAPEMAPSTSAVNNVLNYSKALSVRESSMLKKIEMILN